MISRPLPAGARDDILVCHLVQRELAQRWRLSPRTLERWRSAGTGPAWLRLNGRVVYPLEHVIAFERARLRRD
jgi:hypothetical protein